MALCRITRAHAHTLAFACTPRVLHSSSPSPTRSTTPYITERVGSGARVLAVVLVCLLVALVVVGVLYAAK